MIIQLYRRNQQQLTHEGQKQIYKHIQSNLSSFLITLPLKINEKKMKKTGIKRDIQ